MIAALYNPVISLQTYMTGLKTWTNTALQVHFKYHRLMEDILLQN